MDPELAEDLDPTALDAGLLNVLQRHPLLNIYVEEDPQTEFGFYQPAIVPPIRSPSSTPRRGAAGVILSPRK
jgi:hypothetical protein